MHSRVDDVLQVLDDCCAAYAFPLLDNGYVYPAAARLSLHHSNDDWAIVIETFGYAPREGTPSTIIQTFASRLVNRKSSEQYVNRQAYQNYLAQHPHNEFRSVYPFDDDWEAIADEEGVAQRTQYVSLRGARMNLPTLESYATLGIDLENRPRVQIFELCRAIADLRRNDVLATIEERRHNLDPTLREILVLDEWRHPEFIEQNENRATPKRSSNWLSLSLPAIVHDIDRRCLRTRIGGTGSKLACSECAPRRRCGRAPELCS